MKLIEFFKFVVEADRFDVHPDVKGIRWGKSFKGDDRIFLLFGEYRARTRFESTFEGVLKCVGFVDSTGETFLGVFSKISANLDDSPGDFFLGVLLKIFHGNGDFDTFALEL